MKNQARQHDDRPLSVHLEVSLGRRPVTGLLRADKGDVEEFVGWLGFVEALRRMSEARPNERS
jgi:hypothetical protein